MMKLSNLARMLTRVVPGMPALIAALALGCGDERPIEPQECAANETRCSNACFDTRVDVNHCGSCELACNADEACVDGECVVDCVSSQIVCSGTCVNPKSDNANCGACGNVCDPGQVCSNGACALSCQEMLTDCSGDCVDTSTDVANCGACGNACNAGQVCVNSTCALTCQDSLTECNGTCVNTMTDLAHCGGCDKPCASGEVCSAGTCALSCQTNLTDCNGLCVNTMTDLDHCGGCGLKCDPGEVCTAGACTLSCQTGLVDCNGTCIDVLTNPGHCGACGVVCAPDAVCDAGTCKSTTPVDLQFLSVSDWHGQVDPVTVSGVDIGGAAVLSSYFKQERLSNANTITVTSGDAFGASVPLAAFFDEAPAVKALNLMGLNFDTFGNHNFDKGIMHLQSMIDLATYDYVSSNLNNLSANLTGVEAPYKIVDIQGVKVAFIGITNPSTETIFPNPQAYLGTITIANSVTSAMNARNAAAMAGAKVFIALIHEGVTYCTPMTNNCLGPLVDFAQGVTGFDVIFGDHTDIEFNKVINGAHVVQNRSKGLTYARVNLSVIPYTGFVTKSSAAIIQPIKAAVTPDPAVETMLTDYRMQLAAQLDGIVGTASALFPRGNNIERLGEVALGNLVTDAFRLKYGTQLAMVNGGGLRAPIPSNYLPANTMLRRNSPGYASGPPFDLVIGDAYAVLPFGNIVVTRTVTGTQLWAAMEYGIGALPAANGRFPQISGFGFTYSAGAPAGSRIIEMHLSSGTPIPNDLTTYTLALPNFINAGGDGYTVFADGQGVTREVDAKVLEEHMTMLGMLTPSLQNRIVAMP